MSLATRPSQDEEPSVSATCCVRAITAAAVVVELANTPETVFDKPRGLLVRSEATILDAGVVIVTWDYATDLRSPCISSCSTVRSREFESRHDLARDNCPTAIRSKPNESRAVVAASL